MSIFGRVGNPFLEVEVTSLAHEQRIYSDNKTTGRIDNSNPNCHFMFNVIEPKCQEGFFSMIAGYLFPLFLFNPTALVHSSLSSFESHFIFTSIYTWAFDPEF